MVGLSLPALAGESVPLQNPDFESSSATEGWEMHVYGAQPQVALDTQVFQGGRSSLRIAATEASDTALGQEARLKPNQWYLLDGWVRTRRLDPLGAPTFGTLQVQNPGGRGTLAAGANHGGNTDWTRVTVYFKAPPDGRVRLCLFFVGFGKGTGTAWFDELRLEETRVGNLPVKVTRRPLCDGEISPLQYGQFVEYLCDLVPGMWAEKLADGSFEGLSPYAFAFLKETDFKARPWYPSGAVNRAQFLPDPQTSVSGQRSQKLQVDGPAPCTVGISQDGVFLERGQANEFKVWLRAEGIQGPVAVSLHRESHMFAQAAFQPTAEWKKHSARLVSSGREVNATLTIAFGGPGTLWLDNASLMPTDALDGWRRDVVEAVRALKPGVIRFGGSVVEDLRYGDFDWKDTIGDPERRRPFRAWGGLQPTGPGLHEFIRFCRLVGAEPLLCVRFSQRTPQDAADQVEYFNGKTDTPMGALRARHGHPEPHQVKYWQIGNEQAGADYEERLAAFCAAMKRADPALKLFSSFPTPEMLRKAGPLLDYVCPHHYTPDLAAAEQNLQDLRRLLRELVPGRLVKVAVTEWNTTAGDWGPRRAMLWTLANALACSRYHHLLHRYCNLVELANRSNLANSFCSGIVQTDNHRLYKTPTYYAQQLYATLAGNKPLTLESAIPANVGLDLSATLSADQRHVTLFAVNDTLDDIERPVDFSAFGTRGQKVSVWTLADRRHTGEPDVTNSFGEPDRVATVQSAFRARSARFDYRFPALSLTVLRWTVEQ
jgi:alpha-N-arabinofuranosidase